MLKVCANRSNMLHMVNHITCLSGLDAASSNFNKKICKYFETFKNDLPGNVFPMRDSCQWKNLLEFY